MSTGKLIAAAAMCVGIAASASANTIDNIGFDAVCVDSHYKEGAIDADLRKQKGTPFFCDSVLVSHLSNGHMIVNFTDRKSNGPVFGFGTSKNLETTQSPNLFIMPVERIYLPVPGGEGGSCIINGGGKDVRQMKEIVCIVMISSATQRTVFHIDAHVTKPGKIVSVS
jgi:hypothetical protein